MLNICSTYDNPVWKKFSKDENGFWFNERMEIEIKKRVNWCQSRRNNKLQDPKVGKAKQHMSEHMSKHMNAHMLGHMGNGNGNENIDINRDREESVRGEEDKGFKEFLDETLKSWNALCLRFPVLPSVTKITPKRRKHLKERFANKDFVENWNTVLSKIPTSPFLLGKNNQEWVVNFDFLIRNDESYIGVLEGKYHERKAVFR